MSTHPGPPRPELHHPTRPEPHHPTRPEPHHPTRPEPHHPTRPEPVEGHARAVLIVIGGLPASGKSTVAAAYAAATRTPYLRVDRIEQTLVDWSSLTHPVGPVGYAVGYALAGEQLRLGLDVVVECVNPLAVTREAWSGVATEAGAGLVEVEMVCSDPVIHRRRVEQRATDVAGLVKPDWVQVAEREYEPWRRPHLVIDSSRIPVAAAVGLLQDAVRAAAPSS